ncbi:uncharacterized protein LOC134853079 [Symsagittifera roscoffensis]|uniref:uncharacterized protein LOC134853079 n=1 Tax=Symsagittifera roscoffensis TaxID=84072 RepID=UPI00307CA9E5
MNRRRVDGKSTKGTSVSGSAAISIVGGGTSKSLSSSSWRLEQKDKREREEVVVAALSVLSNATNKHLLQQHDTQNAARAIALNLEEPVVVEKMWEKKGLSTLITSLQRTLQYARGSTDTSSSSSSLGGGGGRTGTAATNATATAPGGGGGGAVSQALLGVNAHLHRSIWALTQHAHFAKMAVRHGLGEMLLECVELENRKKTPFVDCDKPSSSELISELAILYNLALHPDNTQALLSLSIIPLLLPAIHSPSHTAQAIASLTCLSVVGTEDACNKVAEAGALHSVIQLLHNFLDGSQQQQHPSVPYLSPSPASPVVEWDVMELLQALFKLSTSEANKHRIVQAGGLGVLVRLLSGGRHERVRVMCLRCLWSLSFHPSNKWAMQCEPHLLTHLTTHSSAVNPLLRKHAQGILWVLHFGHSSSSSGDGGAGSGDPNSSRVLPGTAQSSFLSSGGMNVSGSGEHVEEDSAMGMGIVPPLSGLQQQQGLHSMGGSAVSSAPSTGDSLRGDMGGSHVYISVEAHDNLAVKRIKGKLLGCGRQAVTLDESSCSSYIDSISTMIESASCLLICASLRYKESPEMRTEVEYAVDMGRSVVGVVVEQNYRPDGWIARHIPGNRPWLDMHHANLVDANFGLLLKDLDTYMWASHPSPPDSQSTSTPRLNGGQRYSSNMAGLLHESTDPTAATAGGVLDTMATRRDHPLLQWSEEDVAQWVDTLNLTSYSPSLKTFPGRYLLQLQRMNANAPEFYYQTLEKKLGLSEVSDLLNFASALAQVVELSHSSTPNTFATAAADTSLQSLSRQQNTTDHQPASLNRGQGEGEGEERFHEEEER